MKPKFEIQIAEPCHENWDIMSLAEKGRFCDVCSKVVVDFTSYSDAQLIEYFSKRKDRKSERLCGRFKAENVVVPQKIEVHETTYYQLKTGIERFLWLLLVSLGFVVVSCTDNAPKGKIDQPHTKKQPEAQVLLQNEVKSMKSPESVKTQNDKIAPLKSKKVQKCEMVTPPVELMGEPMDVIMGGIEPPHEAVTPAIIKSETLMGDTIIREQQQPFLKGNVAFPRILPPKSIIDSAKSKRGE